MNKEPISVGQVGHSDLSEKPQRFQRPSERSGQIEKKKVEFETAQGRLLGAAIVRRYAEFKKKKKRKPDCLYLGRFQKEIVDNDERLQQFIADGEVVYSDQKSEVRFK